MNGESSAGLMELCCSEYSRVIPLEQSQIDTHRVHCRRVYNIVCGEAEVQPKSIDSIPGGNASRCTGHRFNGDA